MKHIGSVQGAGFTNVGSGPVRYISIGLRSWLPLLPFFSLCAT